MHPIAALTIVASTVGVLLNPVVGRLRRRRQRQRGALSHIDDHLLRDIGLSRTDVIARHILEE
jgi:uncharacterized protein YjiS (DUF1127 family)